MNIDVKDQEVIIDGVVYTRKATYVFTPPNAKFAVGQWIVGSDYPSGFYHPTVPSLITKVFENRYFYEVGLGFDSQTCGIRLATKEEVATYLQRVFKEKYAGKKIKSAVDSYTGWATKFFYYSEVTDSASAEIEGGGSNILFYEKGRWAEILDEKRPAPRTREEFHSFIGRVFSLRTQDRDTANDFLNQYDFQ